METLQSIIFIEFDVNTKKITFLRNDNVIDYDSNITNIYVRVKYKNLNGNTVYLTPSELKDYKFSLYTIKPLTTNVNLIRGKITDELKENVYGGIVKFEIPGTCTNRLGIVKCEIHINQGNKIIASSTFILDVKQSLATAFDDELLGDKDFPVLRQLILEIQKASSIDDVNITKITTYSSDRIEDIKDNLSFEIKNKTENIKNNLSSQIKEKVTKGEGGVITTAMLSQEVREAMTGGSVAVVGIDSVLEPNIVDREVTPRKTNFVKQINLFDKDKSIKNKVLTYPSGTLESSETFNTSDFIEVTPSGKYTLNIANYDTVFIYDSNKVLIEKMTLDGWGIKTNTITMPENAKYIRLCYLNEYEDKIMLVEGEKMPNEYCSYDDMILKDIKQNIFKENPANKNLEGTYLFFGDSICYGAGSPGGYARKIAENNPKMTYINHGISGATVAKRTTRSDSVLEQVENSNDNPDYIILEGGVNDAWVSDVVLGTYDVNSYETNNLDVNTYSGALETLFNNVQNKWHNVPIFFIIPHNMDVVNTKAYMDRAVELCQKWSIILIDLRKLSGLNVYNDYAKTTYTNNGDGVHPNELGYVKYYIKPIANILSQYKY